MEPVQYFIGVLKNSRLSAEEIGSVLEDAFGALEAPSPIFPFSHTNYYQEEMGPDLERIFFSLKGLDSPTRLSEWKENALVLEKEFFSAKGKRLANIDPGYLDIGKIVLASTKPGNAKIALTPRIYADMVLEYSNGDFHSFRWTFPDFKDGSYFSYFKSLRGNYLKKI